MRGKVNNWKIRIEKEKYNVGEAYVHTGIWTSHENEYTSLHLRLSFKSPDRLHYKGEMKGAKLESRKRNIMLDRQVHTGIWTSHEGLYLPSISVSLSGLPVDYTKEENINR